MKKFPCLLFNLLVSIVSAAFPADSNERPNIVFVVTDDHAPTAVGIENPEVKTPNMDRIFREGARLKNAFATTPSGSSSRASLMTSRYGSELGITDWISSGRERQLGLDPRLVTWPELLAKAGYRNGLVGKWHLGTVDRFHPTRHGYHYFMGFQGGGNTSKDPVVEINSKRRQIEGFTPDILTDHALEFIRRNKKGQFLLSLHFRAPHIKWLPVRDEDWAPYKDLDPKLPDPDFPHLDTTKLKQWTREYYASVTSVDRNLGRVMAELDKLKLSEKTVVIFTSDHGYHLGQKGLWFKGNARRQLTKHPKQVWPYIPPVQRPNLFDQSIRVPAAVRWPSVIKPGTVVTETVTNLDWFPTLLEIAGVKVPESVTVRGRSISALLRGKEIDWDNDLYLEYSMKHMAQTHMRGWRTAKWKLSIDFLNAGRIELYDMENDPAETANLADSKDPETQKVRKRLTERITRKMREIGDPTSTDPKENQKALKSLSASHRGASETGWGWEQSFKAGRDKSGAKPIHATEITHLTSHKGRLYAGNGYWMDSRTAANIKSYSQVLVLASPDSTWKVDLELGGKHLRVTALNSLTFKTDGNGKALIPPVTLLLAGSDGNQQSSVWTRHDDKNTWVKTTFQDGGQFQRSTRAFIGHRDRKTGIDQVFVAAGELGIYSGVYNANQPGRIRWAEKPELGPGVVRPMSFAEANGHLYGSSGVSVYRRMDGESPRWDEVYSGGGRTSWAMGGIRGLSPVASPDGNGESLLFTLRGRIIRLDPGKNHKATVELEIRDLIEKYLGIPVRGHILAAYSSMLPVTNSATGRPVHIIGVQSNLGGNDEKESPPHSFSGYYSGGAYLIRESDMTYRVKEVNGRWMKGKPVLLAPRTYSLSPFPDDGNHIYFGGYDSNFLPAEDTAWIFRTSLKTALSIPTEVFELRTYTANEGKLDKLNARFSDHTLGFFKKHGMESVGYWMPVDRPNTLVYMLKHKDRDAAQASWKSFSADQDWKKIAKASNRAGRLLAKAPDSLFMTATDYSPKYSEQLDSEDAVFELRTYTTNADKLDNLNARFQDHTMRLFVKHGMESVSYWIPTDEPASETTLIYILKHKTRDAAQASWKAFLADTEWQKVASESQKEGRILARKPDSVFMRATDYSLKLWSIRQAAQP